jgi:hypothetical protein
VKIYVVAGIVLAAFVVSTIVAAQPMQQAQPSLINPGLDKPYSMRGNAPEVMVANGWSDPVWRGRRPEFKPDTVIVRHGESQKWFVRFDNLRAAIGAQPKGINAGDWLRVTAWVYPWSSQKDDVTRCQSSSGSEVNFGKLAARVCVNRWGADPFEEPYSTDCSVQALECGEWNEIEVIAQVQSPNAKVWLLTESRVNASHQDVWWDDVSIERVPGVVITATPQPTYTPYPTPQPTSTGVPGEVDYERINNGVATVIAEWDRR